jgi:peptidoglycan/xylan/chitin deacetylase (PgdA/CDA1 family)
MPPARFVLFAASVAMLGMTGRALLLGPPPLGVAIIAFVAYVALVLGGVFVLRLRIFADAVVNGPRGACGVALTFDDGPHPRWTPRVLELLAAHDVKATFFVVGRKVEQYPALVRAIADAGHSVGLHSYAHDRWFALRGSRRVKADLERGITALERATGRRPLLFRPPIGHTNPIIARAADDLDLTVVGWTIGARDGIASARSSDVVARVRRDLRDGVIVLLHDSPERGDREPAAIAALPSILDAIASQGLDTVPLSRWMEVECYRSAGGDGSST